MLNLYQINLSGISVLMAVLLLAVSFTGAQTCNVDSGYRGGAFTVYYEQRHLVKLHRSLDEMPPQIREKLDKHLRDKLGSDFVKKLKLEYFEYLDLEQLRKEFPSLYDINAKIGAYDLLFRFSDKANGLKFYYVKMRLNEDGTVADEIDLPNIAFEPNKAKLIPCKRAVEIAASRGFPKQYQSVEFRYSPERGRFIWIIHDKRETTPDSEDFLVTLGHIFNYIDIDANSGEVVRTYKSGFTL